MNIPLKKGNSMGRALWSTQLVILITDLIICENVGLGQFPANAMVSEVMNLLCIAILVIMSLSCLRAPASSRASQLFQGVLFLLTIYLFLDSLSWLMNAVPSFRGLHILVALLYHIGTIIQTWIYWYFLCAWLELPKLIRRQFSFSINFLGTLSCLLILGNLWGGYFYFINYDNVYVPSPDYGVFLLGPFLMMVLCFIPILKSGRAPAEKAFLIIYPMVPYAGYLISMYTTNTVYGNVLLFLSIFLFYNNLYVSRERYLVEMQAELREKHTQLMLSQIQPHFLYNSLGAISHLCKKDALLARQAIDSFADYLRMNLDSINENAMVPFSRELEHIRKYLWLEQLRFGDDLWVEYDIRFTDFKLPSLTLQPLVENAVKHGICRTEYGGTVAITVEKLEKQISLTVRDDGAGFDPAQPPARDGRSHLGIDNVRIRLDSLCGGKLEIKSRPGEGTTATILLPMEVLQ